MAGKNTAVFRGIYPSGESRGASQWIRSSRQAFREFDHFRSCCPDSRSTKEFAHEKDTKRLKALRTAECY